MRGRTIRQFLIDGQAEGRWISELSNWTGKAYKIPRTYINACGDRDDLNYTGVYFLIGRNDETDEEEVYIGETENVLMRLKQHLAEKDFWTESIVFISKDNNLNKAHIKYLEYHLYNMAKKSKRYVLVNNNTPAEVSISEMDCAEMNEFIDNMRLILGVLGHKILEPVIENEHGTNIATFYLQERSGVNASGRLVAEGFAILRGSVVSKNVKKSLSKSIVDKRQALFDKGIINQDYTFTQDWVLAVLLLQQRLPLDTVLMEERHGKMKEVSH